MATNKTTDEKFKIKKKFQQQKSLHLCLSICFHQTTQNCFAFCIYEEEGRGRGWIKTFQIKTSSFWLWKKKLLKLAYEQLLHSGGGLQKWNVNNIIKSHEIYVSFKFSLNFSSIFVVIFFFFLWKLFSSVDVGKMLKAD